MDKYEYQVCTEQIKSLIGQKRFKEAMDVADTIDWRRVRSVSMLCTVSEIYKINKRYEDSRDILLLAYERHPTGRDIIYALCELAIKTGDIVQAIECYKEFVAIAQNDPDSFVLLYKIYKAQDVSLEEQIDVLEQLKANDYREKWAYELAYLYHLTGQETKCIAECDELIIWFGEGKYVRKAMELKMQHTTLTKEQQAKYEGKTTGTIPTFNQPYESQTQFGNNAAMTGPMMSQYGEYIQQTGQITGQLPEYSQNTGNLSGQTPAQYTGQINGPQMDQFGNLIQTDEYGNLVQVNPQYASYGYDGQSGIQVTPQMNHLGMTQDIIIQPSEDGRWSTIDLQEQLGAQVQEVLAMNVNGTQPINFENNQQMFEQAQIEYTNPQLFEEKYNFDVNSQVSGTGAIQTDDSINDNSIDVTKVPLATGAVKVDTGVIDLSGVDLPPVEENKIEVSENLPEKEDVIVSIEKRSLDETTDILSQLQGVIPGTAPMTKESAEVERISGTTAAVGTGTIKGITAIQGLPDELPDKGVNGSIINKPQTKSEVTGAIPTFLPSEKDLIKEKEDKAADQEENDKTESVEIKVENAKSDLDANIAPEKIESEDDIKEESNTENIIEDIVEKDNISQDEAESKKDNASEDSIVIEAVKPKYPYDTLVDMGFVEELPELNQPDDVDAMYETHELPVDQIDEEVQRAYETDTLPEVEEYDNDEEEESDGNIYTRMKKDVKSKREFDDDEFRIFCRYDGIESLKAQLVDAMDLMSMEGNHGNITVMGPENADRKEIAINIVKVLKEKNPVFSGKVAKISGEALNKKNIKATLSKLENGALIVESAGGLTAESMVLITSALTDEEHSILVVLEDVKANIKPLLKSTKLMKTVFDARVDINDYSNADLVAYGRGYALEKEYVIDEMGTLALSQRIGECETFDHKVTVDEVKDIVDEAIEHVDKKNVGHFMDVLLGKRYDDDDYIILKEKDFNF